MEIIIATIRIETNETFDSVAERASYYQSLGHLFSIALEASTIKESFQLVRHTCAIGTPETAAAHLNGITAAIEKSNAVQAAEQTKTAEADAAFLKSIHVTPEVPNAL